MSYICNGCDKAIRPTDTTNTVPNRVVIETRRVKYPPRTYYRGGVSFNDPGGVGTEIVREHNLCPKCSGVAVPKTAPETMAPEVVA